MSSLPELAPMPAFELIGSSAIPQELIDASRASASAVGYAHGWAQGLREARDSMAVERIEATNALQTQAESARGAVQAALAALHAAILRLDTATTAVFEQNTDDVLSAAVDIAEALLGQRLADVTEASRAALRRVLRGVPGYQPVVVHLSSTAHATLSGDAFTDLLLGVPEAAGRSISFEADPSLAVGDAVAHCGNTTVDARLTDGVRRLREHLAAETNGTTA
ncbi:hypothetical protein M6D93_16845 [Jatrophihabitans telluris]|uniref:Flagellar assembly protein FliH/Type III secretion system HrpE domain-containing protein n=1 Tax=Jatrophihabitans telluris TaxID=2038343 RepID=A0ABY4QWV7_9ACTN|nr:hypothetical protein [Jatrophihabitans telluris]UQX87953.1 hypothetical protein M6D93_16845 [Jatrophihabitans telluris]